MNLRPPYSPVNAPDDVDEDHVSYTRSQQQNDQTHGNPPLLQVPDTEPAENDMNNTHSSYSVKVTAIDGIQEQPVTKRKQQQTQRGFNAQPNQQSGYTIDNQQPNNYLQEEMERPEERSRQNSPSTTEETIHRNNQESHTEAESPSRPSDQVSAELDTLYKCLAVSGNVRLEGMWEGIETTYDGHNAFLLRPKVYENLRELNVSNTRSLYFETQNISLLMGLGSLPNLKALIATNNKLRLIPDVSENRELELLNVSGNKIHSFQFIKDRDIANYFMGEQTEINMVSQGLQRLENLEIINVTRNNIHEIGRALDGCMHTLKELHISWNRLHDLTDFRDAIKRLEHLEKLSFVGNPGMGHLARYTSPDGENEPTSFQQILQSPKLNVPDDDKKEEIPAETIRSCIVAAACSSLRVLCGFQQNNGIPMVEKVTKSLRESSQKYVCSANGRQFLAKLNSEQPARKSRNTRDHIQTKVKTKLQQKNDVAKSKPTPKNADGEHVTPREYGIHTYQEGGITYTVEDIETETGSDLTSDKDENTLFSGTLEDHSRTNQSKILDAVSALPFDPKRDTSIQSRVSTGIKSRSSSKKSESRNSSRKNGDSKMLHPVWDQCSIENRIIPGLDLSPTELGEQIVLFEGFADGSVQSHSRQPSKTNITGETDDMTEMIRNLKIRSDSAHRARSSNVSRRKGQAPRLVNIFENGTAKLTSSTGSVCISVDIDNSMKQFQEWLSETGDPESTLQKICRVAPNEDNGHWAKLYTLHAYTVNPLTKEAVCCVSMDHLGEGVIQDKRGNLVLQCFRDGTVKQFDAMGNLEQEWNVRQERGSVTLVFELSDELACTYQIPSQELRVWRKQSRFYFCLRHGSNLCMTQPQEQVLPDSLKDWSKDCVPLDGQHILQKRKPPTAAARARNGKKNETAVSDTQERLRSAPSQYRGDYAATSGSYSGKARESNVEDHLESLAQIRSAVQSLLQNMSS